MPQDAILSPGPVEPFSERLTRRQWAALILVGALLLLARAWAASSLYLFPDEALYYWQGMHVPFGFEPHPPGAPLLARAGVALLGRHEIGVRIFSVLLSSFLYVPVFLLARSCAGARAAFWATLLCMSVPFFLLFGCVDTPDTPQLLLWTVALLLTWRALQTDRNVYWLCTGAVVALGLYVKYIIILYFPSLLICLFLAPQFRRFFRRPGPYICLAVTASLFLPVAVFQELKTNWGALSYHLEQRQKFHFSLSQLLVYHGAHAGYLSPLIYAGAIAAMVAAGIHAFKRRDRTMAFLFAFSAFPYLFFASIAAVTKRELSREQWDAISYVPALIAGGILVADPAGNFTARARRWVRRYAVAAAALGLTMCMLLWAEAALGVISSATRSSPLFTTILGWKEMAREVDRAFATLPDPRNSFLLGSSFWESFEYYFYRTSDHGLYVHGSNNDEKFGVINLLKQEKISRDSMNRERGHDAVYVENDVSDESAARRLDKLRIMFERAEPFSRVTMQRSGRVVGIFRIYRCYNLRRSSLPSKGSTQNTSP